MSKLIVIKAPSKEDVLTITEMLPEILDYRYQIVVLPPNMNIEPFSDLSKRLSEHADKLLEKLERVVGHYVS